jgi:putative sigma-54 modulation protein
MRLQVTMRHGHVNDAVRSYVERKFDRLGRRLDEGALVEVVLDREHNPKISDDHVVEAEIHLKGTNAIARESAPTFEAATDLVVDKLERQVDRARDKANDRRRKATGLKGVPIVDGGTPGAAASEESAA